MLQSYGMDLKTARGQVSQIIGRGEDQVGVEIPFTARAKKMLDESQKEATALGHHHIGTEHLLLALLNEAEGVAAKVFENMNIDRDRMRQEMLEAVSQNDANKEEEATTVSTTTKAQTQKKDESESSILDEFTTDLTARAKKGELDPTVGYPPPPLSGICEGPGCT